MPYDAIFAPMAVALREVRTSSLPPPKKASLERILEQWYIASALSQRYQEGVHNKQEKDLRDFRLVIAGETAELPMLVGISYKRLINANPSGAIGKLVRCLLNLQHPKDPMTEHPVGYSGSTASTEKHHIFPMRWVSAGLNGWSSKEHTADLALNLMLVEEKTNKRWVNFSPKDQVGDLLNQGRKLERVREQYRVQHIPSNAFDILQRGGLTASDFTDFLVMREAAIQKFIRDRFGLDVSGGGAEDTDSDEDLT